MTEAPLPDQTADDTDVGWGDDVAGDEQECLDDERLNAERPPHHDRD
jgi:hypothetical protein